MSSGDTIVAQSTPYGFSGIGVVRLSGAKSTKILQGLSKTEKTLTDRAVLKTTIVSGKRTIDEVMVVYYKNPKSFTGEDVVEISCHGSPFIVESIIQLCVNLGARTAGPGEFTRRAYENGKIDLIQAESIANTIAASSKAGLYNAMSGVSGEMSANIMLTSKNTTNLLSYCEHLLDVSDDDIQKDNITHIKKCISKIHKDLNKISENYDTCRVLTYGADIVLAGKTNSGKSTLFNSLIGDERSIVNKTAGTTRDYVDAKISISGVPIKIVDTAGLRKSKNEIESTGIRKSVELVKKADLVLFVVDILKDNPLQVIDNIELVSNNLLIVYNKIDLDRKTKHINNTASEIYVSALKMRGISNLKKAILKKLNVEKIPNKLSGISTPRQYECIRNSLHSLDLANKIIMSGIQLELICFELENVLININSLLGINTDETVLNSMFDSFCVGK